MKTRALLGSALIALASLARGADPSSPIAPVLQSFVEEHMAPGVVALVANIGWSVKLTDEEGPAPGSVGHRGACRTAMWIDPTNGLAMVILVERANMPGDQQKVMYGGFMKAAVHKFGGAAASR